MSNTTIQPAPLLRINGRHAGAATLLAQARMQQRLPGSVQFVSTPAQSDDPLLLDLRLHTDDQAPGAPWPQPGTTYAGFSPAQRHAFLHWAQDPSQAAPPAFQSLYISHLELSLLDEESQALAALEELLNLHMGAEWRSNASLPRAILLGFWLRQSGSDLVQWLVSTNVEAAYLEVALGMQAMLDQPLHQIQVRTALERWLPSMARIDDDTLRLRLGSLTASLGAEPLQHALCQLPQTELEPKLWRCQHRQMRFLLPQPAIRRPLLKLLADLASVSASNQPSSIAAQNSQAVEAQQQNGAHEEDSDWQLILEFGQSRSDYFELVLRECHKFSRFIQIMDEDRNMVYRITFSKRELRRFWHIWDYVQNWSSTRAYLNGKELEKWKIWPYSQYLR